MSIDRSMEKTYSLLIKGLTLEEKSWLYKKAKSEAKTQEDWVRDLIKTEIEKEVQ